MADENVRSRIVVSTHSRPKAAGLRRHPSQHTPVVSTHSRPKAAGRCVCQRGNADAVSTHSRPKAAGGAVADDVALYERFNTQPPEGGWHFRMSGFVMLLSFNTQPPEGGWH